MYEVDWDLGSMGALRLLLGEGEVGEKGAIEGGCSRSTLGALAPSVFVKRREAVGEALLEEAPDRNHPPPAALSLGCAGGQGIIPSLCKGSACPTAIQPAPQRREPLRAWLLAAGSVQTRVTVFGEPICESGKFGESPLGEILIFGERER